MHKPRNSIKIFLATILAITINELRRRFIRDVNTRRSAAFLGVLLEPIYHIMIWILVRSIFISHNVHTTLSPSLFILLGAIPWLYINSVVNRCCRVILEKKSLYVFRQIKPLDVIIATFLLETCVSICVFSLLLIAFWWLGITWELYYPLNLLINAFFFMIFVLGVAIILATGCFFYARLQDIGFTVIRMSYIFSGIFYSITAIPPAFREYFAANPVFQIIEIFRASFQDNIPYNNLADSIYLFKAAIISLFLGVSLYFCSRKKIMTKINQK